MFFLLETNKIKTLFCRTVFVLKEFAKQNPSLLTAMFKVDVSVLPKLLNFGVNLRFYFFQAIEISIEY